MKSLNRTLSLVLVLVMVLGLFGVAGAAFTDQTDVQYKEAVEVMAGIGAINGYEDGSFNPTGSITREEAAKLVVYSILGKSVADKLTVSATGFTDVASDRWSAPYIAYLVSKGVINGMGDGTFAPAEKVTGYQMAKMMLVAAGYGAKEEFTGSGWELAVAVAGNKTGVFAGASGVDYTTPATREAATLYAFNGIQAAQVSYNKLFDQYNGVTTVVDGKEVSVSIMDEVYKKLTTKAANIDGVAGYIWMYNGKAISGFVADVAILATSNDGTAIADLINPLKSAYIGYEADSTVVYKLNGAINKAGAEAAALNRGAIVNFYDENNNSKYDTISVTYDTVAKVTGAAVTKTTGVVTTVTVPGLPITAVNADYVTGYEGLKEDDIVIYHAFTVAGNTHYAITKAPTVVGTLNAYNVLGTTLVIDGKQYKTSGLSAADAIGDYAKFATVPGTTFYLDAAGYVVTAVADKTINTLENTVYVLDANKPGFKTEAMLLKADGTTELATIAKMAKYGGTLTSVTSVVSNDGTYVDGVLEKNAFYTYTKNENGTYNLTVAETNTTAGLSITKGNPVLGAAVATNGTVFVYYSTDKSSAQVFTGIANAPTHTGGAYACITDSNGLATFVVAVGVRTDYSTATSANTKYVFPFAPPTTIKVDANTTFYRYNAIVNGEIGTIDMTAQILAPGTLYAVDQFDGDKGSGVETDYDITLVAEVTSGNQSLTGIKDFVVAGTTLLALGTAGDPTDIDGSYVVANDVKVFRYNGATAKTPVEEISLAVLNNMVGDTYAIQATETSLTDGTLTAIYVTVTPAGGGGVVVNADDYDVTLSGLTVSNVNYYTTAASDDLSLVAAIKAKLEADGYTVTKVTFASPDYTFSTTKSGIDFDFTWANTAKAESFKVKVDGTDKLLDKTTKTNALGGTGTFAKQTTSAGVVSYVAIDGSTGILDGAAYETGFYSVTLGTASATSNSTLTITAMDPATQYVKANGTITLTATMTGAVSGTTAKTFTITATNSKVNVVAGTPAPVNMGDITDNDTAAAKVATTAVDGATTGVYTVTLGTFSGNVSVVVSVA